MRWNSTPLPFRENYWENLSRLNFIDLLREVFIVTYNRNTISGYGIMMVGVIYGVEEHAKLAFMWPLGDRSSVPVHISLW